MIGPGWVQLPEQRPHPQAAMVVFIPNVVLVFTPCHGARHVYPQHQAVAGVARRPNIYRSCAMTAGRTVSPPY